MSKTPKTEAQNAEIENKKTEKALSGKSKRLRYTGFSILVIVGTLTAAILLNVFMTLLSNRFNLRVDLTAQKTYTLSDATLELIGNLPEEIELVSLFPQGSEDEKLQTYLELYRVGSNNITVRNVDPVRNPNFVQQFDPNNYGITNNSIIAVKADGSAYKVIGNSEMYDVTATTSSYEVTGIKAEQKITSAILQLVEGNQPTVYFLSGHSEPSIATTLYYLESDLAQSNYLTSTLNLSRTTDALSYEDVIVCVAPQTDLLEEEATQLAELLDQGVKGIFLFDATMEEFPNFNSVLSRYGLTVNTDVVVEGDQNRYYQSPVYLVPIIENPSDISYALSSKNLTALLPVARSITVTEKSGITNSSVYQSSKKSWTKTDLNSSKVDKEENDKEGPFTVVASAIKQNSTDENSMRNTKLAVIGNAGFLTDSSFYSLQGNYQLFMGCLNWMQDRSDAVIIPSKTLQSGVLTLTSISQIVWLLVFAAGVIPLVILAVGGVLWLRRRHL